jgi:hypothetical protein
MPLAIQLAWKIESHGLAISQAPAVDEAIYRMKQKWNIDIEIGKRLEVRWDVDGVPKWWGGKVEAITGLDTESEPVWNLVYDAEPGKPAEEHKVIFSGKVPCWIWHIDYPSMLTFIFSGKNMLVDLEYHEHRLKFDDLFQWRAEGSQDEPPPLLKFGSR